jgi:hypothetical protein
MVRKREGAEGQATRKTRLSAMRGGQRREYFEDIPTSGNDSFRLSGRDMRSWGLPNE